MNRLTIASSRISLLTRTLYSHASLGLDKYLLDRERTTHEFTNYEDKLKKKVIEAVNSDNKQVFTEDLKHMTMLASKEDMEIVLKMVRKFNNQSPSEQRFGSFNFGPVLMRLFYYLGDTESAVKCFKENLQNGFFDQHVTYQILLDLLYENSKYNKMREIFEIVKEKRLNMTKFPKYSVVLMLAACCKENSSDSFGYAMTLWREMEETGSMPLRRACVYFSYLALKQGAADISLKALSKHNSTYITVRSLRAMALSDLGKFNEVLTLLKSVLNIDIASENGKHTYLRDTIEWIKNRITATNDKHLKNEFEKIEMILKQHNLISEQKLEDLLNNKISMTKKNNKTLISSYSGNRNLKVFNKKHNYSML